MEGKRTEGGGCSRREFIKLAAGAAAIGFLSGPRSLLGSLVPGDITCGRCGSTFVDGHVHEEGAVSGVFCPACGVELTRLEYVGLDAAGIKTEAAANSKQVLWDWAQVPFPNRKLVEKTSKAGTIFKDIRI